MGDPKKSNRTPIPVKLMTFHALNTVNVPGERMASSCKRIDPSAAGNKRREIWFYPWLRSFKITYQQSPNKPLISAFIPESNVMTWEPVEGASTA